jgi:hypothetical protein
MMRDLEDLNATWTLLEERADAYPLRDVTASRPRANRARRTGLAVAVSAAVVGTAAVAVIASGLTNPATHQQHRSVAPLKAAPVSAVAHHRKHSATTLDWSMLPDNGHYLFVFDQMPGTTVTSVIGVGNPIDPGGTPQYQEVQTTGPNGRLVFKVNTTDGWRPEGGTPVTVDGTQGYYGSFLLHPEIPGHPVQRLGDGRQHQRGTDPAGEGAADRGTRPDRPGRRHPEPAAARPVTNSAGSTLG